MAHKKLMGFLKFQFCQVKNLASEHTRREHGLEKKPKLFVRNVARQTVSTYFVFPSDIELYPRYVIVRLNERRWCSV